MEPTSTVVYGASPFSPATMITYPIICTTESLKGWTAMLQVTLYRFLAYVQTTLDVLTLLTGSSIYLGNNTGNVINFLKP